MTSDVVILGGGLAGLTLARHLLLDTDSTVVLLERRTSLPPVKQKVGESTVQVGGYYLSRVLELEEHLLRNHYLKYNLRFYWPTPGRPNLGLEDFSQAYIRDLSNVASYQLDRNVLEGEILRLCLENPRFSLALGATGIDVALGTGEEPHTVTYQLSGDTRVVTSRWVVDATGRGKHMAKRRGLAKANDVRHGTFFWWVDGLLDIEKLSPLPRRDRRIAKSRRKLGHLPMFLATNHFVGEGFWFWVIPLQGKTSLGLVYEQRVIDFNDVNTVAKATAWVSERFPLFAADLAERPVLGFSGYKDYSYDCAQTIDAGRWALTGEAGRFSDPLYSPGSDLIAVHNTLIVDAIRTRDPDELLAKARLAEQIMRAVYGAYLPTYAQSYDCLGDPEAFSLKYVWELAVYFAFYVFPFINDLFTDRRFAASHLRAFARLGPLNRGLQKTLSDYFQWRKDHIAEPTEPIHFDFVSVATLARARATFFDVGVETEEARKILTEQLTGLEELARFLMARIAAVALDEPAVQNDAEFVDSIDLDRLAFDPADFARRWAASSKSRRQEWTFDPTVLDVFPTRRTAIPSEETTLLEAVG
jgi:2-polyprenyl-6-methoxyphenol hydroxylase-like FAD-dependent oxidoreductase